MDQQLRDARQVVEDYKKFNQNTIKKVAKRCPLSKAIFYETVKVDENAHKFVEKYAEKAKKKKQEKHLGKQLMNSPKSKVKKPKSTEPKTRKVTNSLRTKIFTDFMNGMATSEISAKYKVSKRRVQGEISKRKSQLNLTTNDYGLTFRKAVGYFKKGLTNKEVSELLNVRQNTISYHRKKYLKSTTTEEQS